MNITADAETLMRQASTTASIYLEDAVKSIDKQFGKNYSMSHPELVAAFINACAKDFHTAILAKSINEAADKLAGILSSSDL